MASIDDLINDEELMREFARKKLKSEDREALIDAANAKHRESCAIEGIHRELKAIRSILETISRQLDEFGHCVPQCDPIDPDADLMMAEARRILTPITQDAEHEAHV